MKTASNKIPMTVFKNMPRVAMATAIGTIVATSQAHAADTTDTKAAPAAAYDPYKNY